MCFFCDCVRDGFCELQTLAREYHVDVLPYIQRERDYQEDVSLHSVIRNPNKCIKCRRCVDVCGEVQTVHNLSMANRGQEIMVVPELGKPMAESACARCGHCVDVCPVGAIYMEEHKDELLYMTHSYDVKTVAQVSETIISELTALYKVPAGAITMEHICSALQKIGFDIIVSDSYAQTLSHRQVEKLIEEGIGKGTVILTNSFSVQNFIDRFFPKVKDKVKTHDSAQKVFGSLAKNAVSEGRLKTVHITAVKEFAAEARETGDVDYVLNARELYRIFLRTGGAPAKRVPRKLDSFGASESGRYDALLQERKWTLEQKPELLELNVDGRLLKCAVARNLGQVRALLESDLSGLDIVRLQA